MGGVKGVNAEALSLVDAWFDVPNVPFVRGTIYKFEITANQDAQCTPNDVAVAFGYRGYRDWQLPTVERRGPRTFKVYTRYQVDTIYDNWTPEQRAEIDARDARAAARIV